MKNLLTHSSGADSPAPRLTVVLLCLAAICAGHACGCRQQPSRAVASSEDLLIGRNPRPDAARTRVLLVHSYHAGYAWTNAITRGLRHGLPADAVELQEFHMDTKRRTDEPWKQQRGAEARALVEEWRPDIVVLADDNAQQYLGRYLVGRPVPKIVYCGVNGDPADFGYTPTTATGLVERPLIPETFALVHVVLPRARRVLVLTDDDETSVGAGPFLTALPEPFALTDWIHVSTFGAWQDAVRTAGERADVILVYTYHSLRESERSEGAVSIPAGAVMRWTIENSTVPLVGTLVFNVDEGALCGYVESGSEQGRAAADYVVQLLHGTALGDLPVTSTRKGLAMLNLAAARRWSVPISPELLAQFDIVKDE